MTTNSKAAKAADKAWTEFVIQAYDLYAEDTDDAEKAKDYRAKANALRAQGRK